MSSLTLSAVEFLWLAQVGGGNCVMIRPWDVSNFLRGRVGLIQDIIKDGWIYNFPGTISLPATIFFSCWIVEVPLLE